MQFLPRDAMQARP